MKKKKKKKKERTRSGGVSPWPSETLLLMRLEGGRTHNLLHLCQSPWGRTIIVIRVLKFSLVLFVCGWVCERVTGVGVCVCVCWRMG